MVVEMEKSRKCPVCGTPVSPEGWSDGLCPVCVFELALEDSALAAEILGEPDEAPTLQFEAEGFSEGDIQGDRYRIRSLLGRGGMGEVWRAYDLKLRQDVALKMLRRELVADRQALEILRQEVRVAREVVSPNVCRVFDLQEVDDQELIAMEYVDGTTLQQILKERAGPLDLDEAREIAAQFLAGLEAIHAAGLVHRDIKPENLMVTRTGRVVVMDFGIAKGLSDGGRTTIAGTPAYMSPEQARGGELDARADIFSAGVVLAEMVEPGGMGSLDHRQRLWEALHEKKPRISPTPWARVITQAVAAGREERFPSASALARALEEVTLRAAGEETARPYPGLFAFQEKDAEYFFGRELEVEALWKKLRRPHLLAVIGPSGAGKSSFLRAGLLPILTDGWQALVLTPGRRPFDSLAQALGPQVGGVAGVTELLQRLEEPGSALELLCEWRRQSGHGLLIVDQFEELFTQNPPEVQERFAELLGRLPLEADIHVLLSMRDDFVMHCHRFEALRPIFAELTPLDAPLGSALRRALVQPALKCGYRFEKESLVEAMLAEVEGERGALPMVAFTAAQLWERRDRETGLLTEKAYEQIGGVGGALAQHAEATMDYIGEANLPIVRELFRHLVTAQGTRLVRDRADLLSVFSSTDGKSFVAPSRVHLTTAEPLGPAAADILDTLIDARLLTSYELPDAEDGESRQQIEVVHESLLTHWSRLVRWRMQDAEGAQLRDELRAQAELWQQHGRADDYLWTGTAFKEYEVWRERYEGGLTATEESFVEAMMARAQRRQKRRRLMLASAFVILLAVLGTVTGLWWRGELARREAVAEARRAEASKLLALGRLEVEEDPTAALAYATASLDLADEPTTRRFILEVLWTSPMAFQLSGEWTWGVQFSPDAEWLAAGGRDERLELWSRASGAKRDLAGLRSIPVGFSRDSSLLITRQNRQEHSLRTWSVAEGRLLTSQSMEGLGEWIPYFLGTEDRILTLEVLPGWQEVVWRSRPLLEGEVRLLAQEEAFTWTGACVDPLGRWLAYFKGQEVRATSTATPSATRATLVGEHVVPVAGCMIDAAREEILSIDEAGTVQVWSLRTASQRPRQTFELGAAVGADPRGMTVSPDARYRVIGASDGIMRVWDRLAPADAEPQILRRQGSSFFLGMSIDSAGEWLAVAEDQGTVLWPLLPGRGYRLQGHAAAVSDLVFSPAGDWLISASMDRTLRRWPMTAAVADRVETLHVQKMMIERLELDPTGTRMAFMTSGVGPVLVPAEGGEEVFLSGLAANPQALSWDAGGHWIAAAGGGTQAEEAVIHLWDVERSPTSQITEAGESYTVMQPAATLDAQDGTSVEDLHFLANGDLLAAGPAGVRRWSVAAARFEPLLDDPVRRLALSADETVLVVGMGTGGLLSGSGPVRVLDLSAGTVREILSHGDLCTDLALDPAGRILVTGDEQGVVRVGRLDGSEPHLLLGHTGRVQAVAVSPDGQWIASAGSDTTVRLWRMPDLSQPPLHTLETEELLARLRALTNLRAVEDGESDTGWSVEIGPFPGWAEVPNW